MTDDVRTTILQGIAAFANGVCEMGATDNEAKTAISSQLSQLFVEPGDAPTLLREASDALRCFPQPPVESAEETERARPIREMLGVTSATDQLAATLRACELLRQMADEIESRQ
jgi:hypothetical protein